jgi:hypothetical protein
MLEMAKITKGIMYLILQPEQVNNLLPPLKKLDHLVMFWQRIFHPTSWNMPSRWLSKQV